MNVNSILPHDDLTVRSQLNVAVDVGNDQRPANEGVPVHKRQRDLPQYAGVDSSRFSGLCIHWSLLRLTLLVILRSRSLPRECPRGSHSRRSLAVPRFLKLLSTARRSSRTPRMLCGPLLPCATRPASPARSRAPLPRLPPRALLP